MNYLSAQVLDVYMWRLVWLVWLGRGRKEREVNYLNVMCWVYVRGGSFGLFGLAVDKKNEKKDYLSVKCWVCTGICMWWLVWLGSEQTSQTSQLV